MIEQNQIYETENEMNTKRKHEDNKKLFRVEKREDSTKSEESILLLGKKCERLGSSNNYLDTIQRRSKHDLKGRDYLCSMCWKSYLSYAAMYVHLKKKHNINIDGLKTGYSKFRV
jgi:hypothetical protein